MVLLFISRGGILSSMMEADQAKRPYHSPARQRQAEETRHRMLEAARGLFVQQGYAGTTLDAIAKAADVSPKTVAAVFGSKRGILAAILTPSAFGASYQQLLEQLRATPEPGRRVEVMAQLTRQVYETLTPEFELVRGASAVAAELAGVGLQVETRRRQYQTRFIAYLSEQGALRRGLPLEEATDELWALTSFDVYRLFVRECGWPAQRYESWLTSVLVQRLLA
jgi:AcrR family transcriptional regulator